MPLVNLLSLILDTSIINILLIVLTQADNELFNNLLYTF